MAFEKIREKKVAIRVLLFVICLMVWFSIIYLFFPSDDGSITQSRNVHSYWLLSTFTVFILWQILFKKKN